MKRIECRVVSSTPAPSPPNSPPPSFLEQEQPSQCSRLLQNLRFAIEKRNIPLAMSVIKQMEKYEKDFSDVEKICNLEQSCKKSAKIATESISKVETLKRENLELRREIERLRKDHDKLSSEHEKTSLENKSLQKKLDEETVRSNRLGESVAFVKSETDKDTRNCQKEITKLRADSVSIAEENKNLKQELALRKNVEKNLEISTKKIEQLKSEVCKYKMMSDSYKAELEHTLASLNQDKKVESQNQLGQILLDRIETMLQFKDLKTPEQEAKCKKLKKRQKILKKYLTAPTPSGGSLRESLSDDEDLSDESSTMSQVATALRNLENNLM